MRPGRARPGYPTWRVQEQQKIIGFNEAGARAPRIRRGTTARDAEGHASMRPGRARPGYHVPGRRRDAPRRQASMRPGRARPGYDRSRARGVEAPEGRFNEAGARAPRIPGGLEVAERLHLAASMRPGRARPGYRHHTTCWRPKQNPVNFERFGNFRAAGIFFAPRGSWRTPGISQISTCCAVSSDSRHFCVASPLEPTRRNS